MSQQTHQTPQSQPQVTTDGRMYPTRSYQSRETRVRTVQQLDQLLADTVDLASQARFAHWNVRGLNFFQLHELFEDLYEVLAAQADDIAERAAALGGQATGTVRAAAARSRIPAVQPAAVTGPDCLEQLVERLAIHDANLYEAIQAASERGDLDTADLLNEVSREVGKYRWFLEAHLETQPATDVGAGAAQPGQPVGQQPPQSAGPAAGSPEQPPRAGQSPAPQAEPGQPSGMAQSPTPRPQTPSQSPARGGGQQVGPAGEPQGGMAASTSHPPQQSPGRPRETGGPPVQ